MINKALLKTYQKDMSYRYRLYTCGGQQGLGMVWRNMMEGLKTNYKANKKKNEKLA